MKNNICKNPETDIRVSKDFTTSRRKLGQFGLRWKVVVYLLEVSILTQNKVYLNF